MPTCLSAGCALSTLDDREGCRLLSSELQRDPSGDRRRQRSLERPCSLSPCCQCSDRETEAGGQQTKAGLLFGCVTATMLFSCLTCVQIVPSKAEISYAMASAKPRDLLSFHFTNLAVFRYLCFIFGNMLLPPILRPKSQSQHFTRCFELLFPLNSDECSA